MPGTGPAITIGNFDGAHLGHAALIRRARELAPRVIALAFDPHPMTRLRPESAPPRLSSFERRAELLREFGADEVVRLEPTDAFLAQEPEAFISTLIEDRHPSVLVEGTDFHFGRARAGNVHVLADLGRKLGFDVEVVEPVEADLSDQSLVTCSSTIVRWLVERGRIGDAARVLGRPYELTGIVVRGDQRGRQIGFPTANLETQCLLPGDGVYAGSAHLPTGQAIPAAIHVGPRATFDDAARVVEAHIIDWAGPGDGAPEYGWPCRLSISHFLRDQARFEGIGPLVAQIERDVQRSREFGVRSNTRIPQEAGA